MPTYEIFIDGTPRKIELVKTGNKSFSGKIGNKSFTVELQTDKFELEKQFLIRINDKAYNIELSKIDREKLFPIKVEGATFKTEVKTPIAERSLATFGPTSLTPTKKIAPQRQIMEGVVTAPMTGKIISVKVKKGDQVKAGQVLCILEAMKMENEINAPKAGIIQEVNVSEGSSVNESEILFVIV